MLSLFINNIEIPNALSYTGIICNFLDFAKEWYIPENGIKVYFEGLMYEYGYSGDPWTIWIQHCYYLLTSLKKK